MVGYWLAAILVIAWVWTAYENERWRDLARRATAANERLVTENHRLVVRVQEVLDERDRAWAKIDRAGRL